MLVVAGKASTAMPLPLAIIQGIRPLVWLHYCKYKRVVIVPTFHNNSLLSYYCYPMPQLTNGRTAASRRNWPEPARSQKLITTFLSPTSYIGVPYFKLKTKRRVVSATFNGLQRQTRPKLQVQHYHIVMVRLRRPAYGSSADRFQDFKTCATTKG